MVTPVNSEPVHDFGAWTEPSERLLFERLTDLPPGHHTSERIRQDLATRHQGLVSSLARRFLHRGEPLEDLLQAGNVGLVKAINGYDITRGHPFTAYAIPMIVGEIKRHFRDTGWAIHVPRRLQNLKMLVHDAGARLTQQLGRPPASQEVARELGLSDQETREGLAANEVYSCLSLDTMISEDNERHDQTVVAQLDKDLELVVDRATLWPLLSELPDQEREVLLMRFFGNHTQSEIAKAFGVSQVQVSRLEARACDRLRRWLRPT
ncbi:SigB/SigF/SigG family RNA polymerase sigma factor [Nonomuraea sp. NPDC049504]|uniref:SigB/SigF/SigG family RNA polymerase sigma factor n=1 Tax=Nonomuraea sp. NPDC049504 TaxID=3154729 RepID=UPI0034460AF8